MAIELTCPGCQRLLRVGDESAGKVAKCPACQTTMTVPERSDAGRSAPSPAGFGDPPGAGRPAEKFMPPLNPYASPAATDEDLYRLHDGELVPTRVGMDELLSVPWTVFQANLGAMAALGGVMFAAFVALFIFAMALQFIVQITAGAEPLASMGVSLFVNLVQFVVNSIVGIAGIHYCMKLLRRGRTSIGKIANIGPYIGSALLKDFLFGLVPAMLIIGMLIAVFAIAGFGPARDERVPIVIFSSLAVIGIVMIVLAMGFLLTGPLIVDQRLGPIAAITTSWRFVSGNVLAIIGSGLITSLLGGIAALCTCYVGLILVMPYLSLYICVCYMLMTGQRQAIAPQALGRRVSP